MWTIDMIFFHIEICLPEEILDEREWRIGTLKKPLIPLEEKGIEMRFHRPYKTTKYS